MPLLITSFATNTLIDIDPVVACEAFDRDRYAIEAVGRFRLVSKTKILCPRRRAEFKINGSNPDLIVNLLESANILALIEKALACRLSSQAIALESWGPDDQEEITFEIIDAGKPQWIIREYPVF